MMSDQELIEALNRTQGIVLKHIAELEGLLADAKAVIERQRDERLRLSNLIQKIWDNAGDHDLIVDTCDEALNKGE